MRLAAPSRRALGLLAVSTIGTSTAVLGATGVASAAPTPPPFTFSVTSATTVVVPAGYCAVDWLVLGAEGGASETGAPGAPGGLVTTRTIVQQDDTFFLYPGAAGGDGEPGTGGSGGASGASDGSFDGANGGSLGRASGGGGAASVVETASNVVIGAFGGDGADSPDNLGGDGGGGGNFALEIVDAERTGPFGVGLINGAGVLCDTPAAPADLTADYSFGLLEIRFDEPEFIDETDRADDYEVSYDGGTTWAVLDVFFPGDLSGEVGATIRNPAPGSYDIVVRGTNEAGNGADSAEVSVLVVAPATDVTATVGVSSILVTWVEPTDTTGISGYQAFASPVGAQSSADVVLCDVPLGVTTCLLGVPAGIAYSVGVGSIDLEGEFGAAVYAEDTGIVPGPATPTAVPTRDDGDVIGPAGPISSVVAGQTLTVIGSGFLPFSTVRLSLLPGPVDLGTVVADEDGSFRTTVTIPADLVDGRYSIVATGTAPDGDARNLVTPVSVTGGVAPARSAALAVTGSETSIPLTGGALALLVGTALLVGARRRTS